MFCIGLTGAIASGKSTVAGYFAALGIEVLSADKIGKALTASGQPAFNAIIKHFGQPIIKTDGTLNRGLLRHIIFQDANERYWLENLLHPLIRQEIAATIRQVKSPYCIIEIPLLLNRSDYPYLNRVLRVLAEPEQQILRVMARDDSSREDALAILATQPDEQTTQALADDTLINSGSLDAIKKKITALHAEYLQYAAH